MAFRVKFGDGYITAPELFQAVEQQDAKKVEAMLELGLNVNVTNSSDDTPLHICCRLGSIEMAVILLNFGAQVNQKGSHGRTPLHWAAFSGQVGLCDMLLQRMASVNARSTSGHTPLHWAAAEGHKDVASLLLDKGSDMEAVIAGAKMTPLHCAAGRGHAGVAALLLNYGARVDPADKLQRTPLHYAICVESMACTKALVDAGANVNAVAHTGPERWMQPMRNWQTFAPLHTAAVLNNLPLTAFLVDHGADLALKCCEGTTALQLAHKNPANTYVANLLSEARLKPPTMSARSLVGRGGRGGAAAGGAVREDVITGRARLLAHYATNPFAAQRAREEATGRPPPGKLGGPPGMQAKIKDDVAGVWVEAHVQTIRLLEEAMLEHIQALHAHHTRTRSDRNSRAARAAADAAAMTREANEARAGSRTASPMPPEDFHRRAPSPAYGEPPSSGGSGRTSPALGGGAGGGGASYAPARAASPLGGGGGGGGAGGSGRASPALGGGAGAGAGAGYPQPRPAARAPSPAPPEPAAPPPPTKAWTPGGSRTSSAGDLTAVSSTPETGGEVQRGGGGAAASTSAAAAEGGARWECSLCTQANDASATSCKTCMTARPGEEEDVGGASMESVGWGCLFCHQTNDFGAAACRTCGKRASNGASLPAPAAPAPAPAPPAPAPVPAAPVPEGAAPFPPAGVMPPPTPAPAPAPAAEAPITVAEVMSGPWDCSLCTKKNDATAQKCAVCGRAKGYKYQAPKKSTTATQFRARALAVAGLATGPSKAA